MGHPRLSLEHNRQQQVTHHEAINLIICGDARGNYRPERAELLRALRGRVRAVHWLNPEPAADWDTSDSLVSAYRPYCDSVTEVRTLRQLSDRVDKLM